MPQLPEDYTQLYSLSPDEDLSRLSLEVESLVPEAREALRLEMERRSLPVEAIDWTAQPEQRPPIVSGWLWLYCFISVFIYPIWVIVTLFRSPLLLDIILIPHSVLVIGSGVLLRKKNPKGLVWVRLSFLYLGALFCLMAPLALLKGVESFLDYVFGVFFGSIPLILWWLYFRKSKLVREIYGHNMKGLPWQRGS